MGKILAMSPKVKSNPPKSKLTRRFKCNQCEFTTLYKCSLKSHAKVHEDESPFACPVAGCTYTAKWEYSLKNHKTTHEDETTVWYECDKCDFKTKYKYVLEKRHAKLIHSEGPIQRRYNCDVCKYGCDSRPSFMEHRKNHNRDVKRLTCDFPGCVFTARWKANMHQHKKRYHGNEITWFECALCNYKTQDKYRLRMHVVTHTEEKPYKCPYPTCDFTGRTKWSVRGHQERLEHFVTSDREISEKRRTKKFKCTNSGCKYSTNEGGQLKMHMKRIHDPKRKRDFKCPLCSKSFFEASGLRVHVRNHTAEKSAICAYPNCKYKTLYPSELKKHEVRVHTATVARFTCRFPDCEASFKVSSYLKKHERTHALVKTFSCTFPGCEAKFKFSGDLKRHFDCHDPEGRPKYPCNLCSAEFLTRSGLYNHISWHTNEKVYKCANCEYSTSRAFLLKSHKCVGRSSNGTTNVRTTRSSVKRVNCK